MDELENEKRNTVCYIGMILIIAGYVFFSNHRNIGDMVIMIGVLMILFKKLIKKQNRNVSSEHSG